MAEFWCNVSDASGRLEHAWEHTIGSGHATLGLRADWQAQLKRAHEELGFRYVRFHGLLSDDMGTLTRQQDELLYSFFNADQIFDFLMTIGMRPFVELSFMPEALASGHQSVFHYRGNVTPPRDYEEWSTLISKLVEHWLERYGVEETRQWFFEVWNEPNLPAFWKGHQQDYFKLYLLTARAIKKVDAQLRVGGPATAKNEWIEEFVEFCAKKTAPLDFISTHHYPTDALGQEDDDTEMQLANSRRSVLREQAQDTFRRAKGKPVHYTEWNATSNPRDALHDDPYAAAFVTKTVMEANGLAAAYSYWTFTDIFEENYFPSVPFHGGFGLLNVHGIPKPVYRAYELLHRLGTETYLVDGMHETVDAWVVRKEGAVTVLLTNHGLPQHALETQSVKVSLCGTSQPRRAFVERIDEFHANAPRAWREMKKPNYLNAMQVEQLQAASQLLREPLAVAYEQGALTFEVELPPHAVAAITLEVTK